MSLDDQARTVAQLAERVYPMLAGLPPEVQGGVIADLCAMYLAGHQGPDKEQVRDELLALHVDTVRTLVPVNEARMRHAGLI